MMTWIKQKWAALKAAVAAHLADDWRDLHRWYSTWAASGGLTVIAAWEAIPDSMRAYLPRWFLAGVAATALVLVLVGRVTRQDLKPKAPPAPPAQPAPQNNGGA